MDWRNFDGNIFAPSQNAGGACSRSDEFVQIKVLRLNGTPPGIGARQCEHLFDNACQTARLFVHQRQRVTIFGFGTLWLFQRHRRRCAQNRKRRALSDIAITGTKLLRANNQPPTPTNNSASGTVIKKTWRNLSNASVTVLND